MTLSESWGGPMRNLPIFAAAALLSGCTVVRIERQSLQSTPEEPAGEIRFMAVKKEKPDRLADGYSLTVMKNFAIVGTYSSSSSEATRAEGLSPGTYDISISGRKIATRSTRIKVRHGEATVVRLMVRNALQLTAAGHAALTAGKVVLYAVGFVVYAVVWVAVELLTSDDDDDEDCFSRSSTPPSSRKQSPHPGSVSAYRKK